MRRLSLKESFWSKIKVNPVTQCWEWSGRKLPAGYGIFSIRHDIEYIHRFIYKRLHGYVGLDNEIHHTCNNRGCCKPGHVQKVSSTNHPGKGFKKGNKPFNTFPKRVNNKCSRGHEMTPENTKSYGRYSKCIACMQIQSAFRNL